ncbi:hypothetical protein [Lachnoclostridium phytofermentans]|nr:hypothetical protein [Lachnoclostridium phytofermentans]
MGRKCKYCNKVLDYMEEDEYCSLECKSKSERFLNYYKKWKVIFYSMILVFIVLLLIPAIKKGNGYFAAYGLGGVGITLFIFPFSTPQGIEMYGIRKAKFIVKVLALVSILLTIFIILATRYNP